MNKQYVQEQINIAVKALRAEYDERLGAIYQCPDCGAVALKTSEHVCLKGQIPVSSPEAKPKPKTIGDYILPVLQPTRPETISDVFEEESPFTVAGIKRLVMESGYPGKVSSIGIILSSLAKENKIKRCPAVIKVTTSRAGKPTKKETTGYVYWRPMPS